MIEVKGLSKSYGELKALRNVSFTVPKGKIVGFLGANGAGKTTTMDIVCGCIGANQGSALICGIDITEKPQEAKMHLGYLPDEPPLYNDMKVEEYVTYAAKLHRVAKSDLKRRVSDTIDRLDLGTVRNRLVGNLSKGFRQRVGLAQAIVHSPDVLVLDEPTEGLDPNQIVQIRDLIKSLAGEHTILLSSHILSEVQNTCEEIIIIHEGQIAQQGTYDQIVSSADLASAGGEKGYKISVQQNAKALADKLKVLRGVSSVEAASTGMNSLTLRIDLRSTSVDDIARAVIEGGYGLREISPTTKSLEEVFLRLTH